MAAGKPPIFTSPEELQDSIDKYFKEGVKIRQVIVGKSPNQQVVNIPVPTITGLCYYLGFSSRQSFYDYEKHDEYSYIIKRARLCIEQEYEEQLQAGNTIGAIFALKNMGWFDKQYVSTEFTNELKMSILNAFDDGEAVQPESDTSSPVVP